MQTAPTMTPTWVRLPKAAAEAGVSVSTVKSWAYRGLIRVSKPGKFLLIHRESLLEFIEAHASGGGRSSASVAS